MEASGNRGERAGVALHREPGDQRPCLGRRTPPARHPQRGFRHPGAGTHIGHDARQRRALGGPGFPGQDVLEEILLSDHTGIVLAAEKTSHFVKMALKMGSDSLKMGSDSIYQSFLTGRPFGIGAARLPARAAILA